MTLTLDERRFIMKNRPKLLAMFKASYEDLKDKAVQMPKGEDRDQLLAFALRDLIWMQLFQTATEGEAPEKMTGI